MTFSETMGTRDNKTTAGDNFFLDKIVEPPSKGRGRGVEEENKNK